MKITTKKLIITALLMALTVVATMFIRIPLPLGYANMGDAFVFLSVFILGPFLGTIAAGVGSAIADLVGFISYAPGTFVIKSTMAIIAYLVYILIFKTTKIRTLAEIIGAVVGAVIMAFGYFFYEILFFESAAVAIVNVPFNLLQGAVGVVVSVAVMRVLYSSKAIDFIQK